MSENICVDVRKIDTKVFLKCIEDTGLVRTARLRNMVDEIAFLSFGDCDPYIGWMDDDGSWYKSRGYTELTPVAFIDAIIDAHKPPPQIEEEEEDTAIEFKWEGLDGGPTDRAKVIGGWIVRSLERDYNVHDGAMNLSTAMVFVPDPGHEWEVK
jgi:hypothetical protein